MSVAVQSAPELPVDPETAAYNVEVDLLISDINNIASTIKDDMKMRQLPAGLVGKKVYGPQAGLRSTFNSTASVVGKVADIVAKLKKGTTKKASGTFVGFSAASFIRPEMATALGLKEGSILWPQGSKPIFSSAMITKFFTNRVLANGLVHENNLSLFKCDDQMKVLFRPYVLTSVKAGDEPINLDSLSYTGIQKLIKNFVDKRSKEIPGPVFTDQLKAVFVQLDNQFKALKETKDKLKKSITAANSSERDLIKAKASLDAREITQELFNGYAVSFKIVLQQRDEVFAVYRAQAKHMGI